jgi:hypothetical protein
MCLSPDSPTTLPERVRCIYKIGDFVSPANTSRKHKTPVTLSLCSLTSNLFWLWLLICIRLTSSLQMFMLYSLHLFVFALGFPFCSSHFKVSSVAAINMKLWGAYILFMQTIFIILYLGSPTATHKLHLIHYCLTDRQVHSAVWERQISTES